jgi:hypothetical protein
MAQNAEPASSGLLKFEAASIKAVAEGTVIQCGELPCGNLPPLVVDPQRLRAMTTLDGPLGLIEWAYGVRSFQVVGAPDGSAVRNLMFEQRPSVRQVRTNSGGWFNRSLKIDSA